MTTKIRTSKLYVFTIFYFMLFGLFIAVFISLINYNIHFSKNSKELNNSAHSITESKQRQVTAFIASVEQTLHSIEYSNLFDNFVADPHSPTKKRVLQELMRTITMSNEDYFQVRLLDKNGMEIIRIEQDSDSSTLRLVPDHALQNKHNRYYFKEASAFQPHTFWHSHLDLNIEHGTIERPLRPSFRVALPIYRETLFYGLLIINVDMRSFLNSIVSDTVFNTYLIDNEGYFISHYQDNLSWSRYLGSTTTIFDEMPEYASQIMDNKSFNNGQIFTFSLEDQFTNGENIKMILVPKLDFIEQQHENAYKLALYIALLTLAFALPMGGLFAIGPARLQARLNNLLKENLKYTDIIDHYVVTSETDLRGRITKVSSAFCNLSGYSKEELIGKSHSTVSKGDTSSKEYRKLWKTIRKGSVWSGELHEKAKDGTDYWVHTTILPEYDEKHKLVYYTAISYDITDKKRVETLSKIDTLTQLGNRAMLDNELTSEIERVRRYTSSLSVIMLDIDHFKQINDNYGHLKGDEVLQKISAIIKSSIRKTDKAGRWGGEEFLILCPETTLDNAAVLAENLRKQIELLDFGEVCRQTASFGVTAYQETDTVSTLVNRTDRALYQAKETGRNRVVTL